MVTEMAGAASSRQSHVSTGPSPHALVTWLASTSIASYRPWDLQLAIRSMVANSHEHLQVPTKQHLAIYEKHAVVHCAMPLAA